jgi:hypothetical protein
MLLTEYRGTSTQSTLAAAGGAFGCRPHMWLTDKSVMGAWQRVSDLSRGHLRGWKVDPSVGRYERTTRVV